RDLTRRDGRVIEHGSHRPVEARGGREAGQGVARKGGHRDGDVNLRPAKAVVGNERREVIPLALQAKPDRKLPRPVRGTGALVAARLIGREPVSQTDPLTRGHVEEDVAGALGVVLPDHHPGASERWVAALLTEEQGNDRAVPREALADEKRAVDGLED